MILTNEDLLAISQVVDARLDVKLNFALSPIKQDIDEIKEDLSVLKEDVSILKEDVSILKEDVSVLKERVSSLEENVQSIDSRLRNVELFNENVILPRLNTIESCYLDTYHRYQRNNDKMELAFDDIDLLKKVAMDHSEKLQKLA